MIKENPHDLQTTKSIESVLSEIHDTSAKLNQIKEKIALAAMNSQPGPGYLDSPSTFSNVESSEKGDSVRKEELKLNSSSQIVTESTELEKKEKREPETVKVEVNSESEMKAGKESGGDSVESDRNPVELEETRSETKSDNGNEKEIQGNDKVNESTSVIVDNESDQTMNKDELLRPMSDASEVIGSGKHGEEKAENAEKADGIVEKSGSGESVEKSGTFMSWFVETKGVADTKVTEVCPEKDTECISLMRWFRRYKVRSVFDAGCNDIDRLYWIIRVVDTLQKELWGFRYFCVFTEPEFNRIRQESPDLYALLYSSAANRSQIFENPIKEIEATPHVIDVSISSSIFSRFDDFDTVILREGFAFAPSNQRVWRVVNVALQARVKLLIVDNYPSIANIGANALTYPAGVNRPLNLKRSPFNFPAPKEKVKGLKASQLVMNTLHSVDPEKYPKDCEPLPKNLMVYTTELLEYILDRSENKETLWATRLQRIYAS
eukprot:CAMPEP_0182443636 /NCGR_PEP_ID=MMETSP1172-20130603/2323_1 /TAXON_ID=708627 /ORGANISM="Timspurckia oligopyrenoides, Strain CCMP3278" /LENGTH=492 /DNA_ID=CAMNT_0024638985 /DNA_START=284 /DNA_END=1762 /DNA_ORIENTATION=-